MLVEDLFCRSVGALGMLGLIYCQRNKNETLRVIHASKKIRQMDAPPSGTPIPQTQDLGASEMDLAEVIRRVETYDPQFRFRLLNLYQWGSRIYHLHTDASDWDFIAIVSESYPTGVGQKATCPGLTRTEQRNALIKKPRFHALIDNNDKIIELFDDGVVNLTCLTPDQVRILVLLPFRPSSRFVTL